MSVQDYTLNRSLQAHHLAARKDLMISFEVMPPRSAKVVETFFAALSELLAVRPDFVSVTYGAGGKDRTNARDLVNTLVADTSTHPIAHLTTVAATRQEVSDVINDYLNEGVRTFLALRGDNPVDQPHWQPGPKDVRSAAELVSLIRLLEARRCAHHSGNALRQALQPLTIAVATFLGGNPQAGTTAAEEIENLVAKQEAGASFAISQVFWDPSLYASFVEQARREGVRIPIVPGILPATDVKRLGRVGELTGVHAPEQMLSRIGSAPDPYSEGISVGAELIRELLAAGAPGVHIYTFNKSRPALDLLHASHLLSEVQ